MHSTQRPYHSEADLPAILALKQLCTTPQNLYDRPTTGEMRRLLAPLADPTMRTSEQSSQAEALRVMSPEQRHRILTQRLTALWEDASGQLVAYALIAQPGSSLDFQVHPEARGQGVEEAILAWGLAQMQFIARARGTPCDLWCRCHAVEQERRSLLEAGGFHPLFEPDLRLVHPLATPVPPVALPEGFSLKRGVTPPEFGAYQELHQAVFAGMSMNMDDHESSAYLETSETNVPAQRLFTSVGFAHLSTWQWYGKTVEPA